MLTDNDILYLNFSKNTSNKIIHPEEKDDEKSSKEIVNRDEKSIPNTAEVFLKSINTVMK